MLPMERYDNIVFLDEGSYGKIYRTVRKVDKVSCVLKIIDKESDTYEEHFVKREIEIHRELEHERIVKFYETFENESSIVLVLEYLNGKNLRDESKPIELITLKKYIRQLVDALEYLHGKGVIHRDLKQENIIVVNGSIKLIDFGLSVRTTDNLVEFVGTMDYIAPEVLEGKPYNKSIDFWALGVLIYECLCDKNPFEDDSDLLLHIVRCKYIFPENIDHDAQDLISHLVTRENRYGVNEIRSHRFLN